MKKIIAAFLVFASFSSFAYTRPEALIAGSITKIVKQTDAGCSLQINVTQIWESSLNSLYAEDIEGEGLIAMKTKCSELKVGDHVDGVAFLSEKDDLIYLE